jgi:hypothetical protein
MEIKSETLTDMVFNKNKGDLKSLRSVQVHYWNGIFQWVKIYKNSEGVLLEFHEFGELQDLYHVLGKIMEITEEAEPRAKLKAKQEPKEQTDKEILDKGRLIELK